MAHKCTRRCIFIYEARFDWSYGYSSRQFWLYGLYCNGVHKKYSIVITLIGSLNFILTWIAYKLGASVEMTYIIYIGVYALVQVARLILMKEIFEFPINMFLREVLGKIIFPLLTSLIVPFILKEYIEPSLIRMILLSIVSILWTGLCILVFGLTKGERDMLYQK